MLIGDITTFAIESEITKAYDRPSLVGLGFFVFHIAGMQYGVKDPAATMLANALGEIGARIAGRGKYTAPFAEGREPLEVATAIHRAIYVDISETETFFGMSAQAFQDLVNSHYLLWASDWDEAFDDGSYVVQFDSDKNVHLSAFRVSDDGEIDVATLREQRLCSDRFYTILADWHAAFKREWQSLLKQ